MSEEALSPPIHPGRAGPSVGGLTPTAGLSQWRSTVLMFRGLNVLHTRVHVHKGLTSVPMRLHTWAPFLSDVGSHG